MIAGLVVEIVIPILTFLLGSAVTLLAVWIHNRHSTSERQATEARAVLRPGLHSLRTARDMLVRTTPLMLADEEARTRENEALRDDWDEIRRDLQSFAVEHPDREVGERLEQLVGRIYTCVGDRVQMTSYPADVFDRSVDDATRRLRETEQETEALIADTQGRLGIVAQNEDADRADY